MGAKIKGQGQKMTLDENAQSAISVIFHPNVFLLFFNEFLRLEYRQYLAQSPCEFSGPYAKGQGHSETKQKMGVSARICKWHDIVYNLNNSSIHPTYFLSTQQKAKTSLIHVPGRFDQELG